MSDSATSLPERGRELRSTVSDSQVTLALREFSLDAPGAGDVVVRIEASPINPSDLGMLFAGGDIADAETSGSDDEPAVSVPLGARAVASQSGRLGAAMPVGNEGGGVVIAAGSAPEAQALLGTTVGFLSGNAYATHRTVPASACLAMHDGTTSEQAAACFVNPLTALGMVETMSAEGHSALVHTVGASNLGRMLNRVCLADGVGLVNIVRRPEHVAMLREEGARHVVDSSADSFRSDLVDALSETGATIAFDAIGGGELAGTLLSAMEQVASAADEFSRYGSSVHKQVYVYGGLDRGPMTLRRDFGMAWSVGGWLLTPFLAKLGASGTERLRRRVADEVTTTFASDYGMRVTLSEAVDPDMVRRYARMATGDKALVTPNG